uniref:Uncharacterized protein n=1 Tax=Cacopsylla melanoneura TaxID=428564 RepID=A0A8D8TJG2_9HEMI
MSPTHVSEVKHSKRGEPIEHNGYSYVWSCLLSDSQIIYKCAEKSCLGRIKVRGTDFTVLRELASHSSHAHVRKSLENKNVKTKKHVIDVSENSSPITSDTTSSSKKLVKNSQHLNLRKPLSTPESNLNTSHSLNQQNKRQQSNSNGSLNTLNTSVASTMSSTPLTSVVTIDNTSVVIKDTASDLTNAAFQISSPNNIGAVHHTSQTLDINEQPLQSSSELEIRCDELNKLKLTLIDKIIEKEKIIWEQEKCIEDLRSKIQKLEVATDGTSSSQNDSSRHDLEELKTLVSGLLTSVKTLEAKLSITEPTQIKAGNKNLPPPQNKNFKSTKPRGKSTKTEVPKANVSETSCIHPASQIPGSSKDGTRVIVVGDSHVRQLQDILAPKLPSREVQGIFKGGSKLGNVLDLLEEESFHWTLGDMLIIFSGANDVCGTSWNVLKSIYEDILSKYQKCKIGVVLVPLRRGAHQLNSNIEHLNQKIVNFFRFKNVFILDPQSILDQQDYCPDGLHLNKLGKEKMCELIKRSVEPEPSTTKKPRNIQKTRQSGQKRIYDKQAPRHNFPNLVKNPSIKSDRGLRHTHYKHQPGPLHSVPDKKWGKDHYDYSFDYVLENEPYYHYDSNVWKYSPYDYDCYDYRDYPHSYDYYHEPINEEGYFPYDEDYSPFAGAPRLPGNGNARVRSPFMSKYNNRNNSRSEGSRLGVGIGHGRKNRKSTDRNGQNVENRRFFPNL